MTVSDFLIDVNYALTGTDETAPAFGTDIADYWLATLNRKIRELYRKQTVLFDETWEDRSIGTVSASATPTFDLDAEFIVPSDEVFVVTTEGQRISYRLVKARERSYTTRQFFIAGVNPNVLYCTTAITSTENIVGGTIYVPGYFMPDALTQATDELPLPDTDWGVMAVAAFVAFNDITYESKQEGLTVMANDLYKNMVRGARRHTYGNPKKSPVVAYKVKSIEVR